MTQTSEHDPVNTSGKGTPNRSRRGFDPRRALIYCLGALVIVLALAVVLAFFGGSKDQASGPSDGAADVGTIRLGADDSTFTATTLPPSGVLTMNGQVTDMKSVTDGKPTMINMFSSSCTACRTEMPALERLHRAVGDKMQLVGVNLGDSESGTADFVKQTGVTYTIVRDPKLLLVTPLNITAQPMTLWVNANGRITGHRYGALTDAEMRLAVKDYLGIDVPAS